MSTHEQHTPTIAVIVSRYHASVTDRLLGGAVEAYQARFDGEVAVIDAPGAFELPMLCASACQSGLYDGVVCLGCVIRGQTPHNEHIARAVSDTLCRLSAELIVPIGFGLLTCDTHEQALARAGGDCGNKGAEAMGAVLDCLASLEAIGEAIECGDGRAVRRTLVRQIAKLGPGGGSSAAGGGAS